MSSSSGSSSPPARRSSTIGWRTAHHESGHAVVALALRHEVKLASVLPGEHFGGITFSSGGPLPGESLMSGSLVRQRAELRAGMPGLVWIRRHELEAVVEAEPDPADRP